MSHTKRIGLSVFALSFAFFAAFAALCSASQAGVSAPVLASDSSKGGVGG